MPPEMPVEVFRALFPQANADGPVTTFYLEYCPKHMPPGQWPRLNASRPLSDGTTWWDFNPLHIFSDQQGKVWIAGGTDRQSSPQASSRSVVSGGPVTSVAGERIAAEARRLIGRPYVWATHGPDTFDCSGLVHWVVLQATGQTISPDSHAQFNLGVPVKRGRLRPGDIVFYDTMGGTEVREGNRASHVGVMVVGGRMVNALNERAGVREDDPFSDYFKPKYLGARRMA